MSATTGARDADTRDHAQDESPLDLERDLPLLALPEQTVFPNEVQRLDLSSPEARAVVEALRDETRPFVVLALERPGTHGRGSR